MHRSVTIRLAFLLAFALAPPCLGGQSSAPDLTAASLIRSADLKADAAILRSAYEALHPGLYRYNTKAQMDEHFAALDRSLDHDLSLQDAYLAFSLFANQIRCGHTYANFFNQKKSVATALFERPDKVPFYFRWLDRRMVVTDDFTPGKILPRGTQVLSINGVASSAILDQLMRIARADGANDAKRVDYLQVTGDSNYEAFDVYFPMFFPPSGTTFQLSILRHGESKPTPLTVPALTWVQRIAPIKARETSRKGGGETPLFTWSYLDGGVAYLRMPTWAMFETEWDWKTWLNAHLDDLVAANSQALILDLRGNEGGQDVGDEILKRLVATDLTVDAPRRLVRYRQVPAALAPYLDTWDPSFKDWGSAAVPLDKPWPTAPTVSYLALTKYDDDASGRTIIQASGRHFRGRTYVLIDASNSSATFQFAQTVQQLHLGTLVGQPTGGSQRGINGGAFFFLRLPKSGIELDLPLVGTFPATPRPDQGLAPDIAVAPTLEDIASGSDPVLARVTALASGPKQ